MAFDLIYQLRTKKFWWLDTILYFTLALLISTIVCYFIFSIKISFQEKKLSEIEGSIATTGTSQQRDLERKIFEYQKKIDDFSVLLAVHKTPSNLFSLIEQSIFPDVWFSNFSAVTKDLTVKLNGEARDVHVLAQQISFFKKNEFIKDIKLLNFGLGKEGRVKFNLIFSLNPQVFTPLEDLDETVPVEPSP